MFKGDPVVIRTKLRFWEGPNGLTRYYYDRWDHYCENGELESYWEKFHVDPKDFKLGIKIFFDGDGLLHINNCHDPELRIFLEEKMKGWYMWACHQYDKDNIETINVWDVIEPYTTEFKPDMYRVEFNGKMFVFDIDYRAFVNWSKVIEINSRTKSFTPYSGFPRLDDIIADILGDSMSDYRYLPATYDDIDN